MITFEDVFNYTIGRFPNQIPFEYYEDGLKRRITKQDYCQKIDSIAYALDKVCADIPKGRWIGLRHKNHVLWYAAMFALMKIGYRVLFLDENCPEPLLQTYAKQANLAALVSSKQYADKNMVHIDFEEITASEASGPITENWGDRMGFCTSGTTGTAKSIIFSAEGVLEAIKNVSAYFAHDPDIVATMSPGGATENRVLATLPMRHVFGFTVPMTHLPFGHTIVFPKNNNILEVIDAIKRENIWMTYGVPAIWKAMMRICKSKYGTVNAETFKSMFGERFKAGIIGGARSEPEFKRELLRAGFSLNNAYGSTETHGCITFGTIQKEPAEHVSGDFAGVLFNGHVAKLLRPDGALADEGTGELLVKGKALFCATLQDGKEIPRASEYDGFFRTGDFFCVEKGYFYYQGRTNNLIINDSGENIYPEELQEYFFFIENECEQSCVMGIGDEPVLIIKPNEYDRLEESALLAAIREKNAKLPVYKRLAKVIAFREELPKTNKGEIVRSKVEEEISKRQDGIKEFVFKGKRGARC
jgi:acyl-CoA synthetase (AMP-forming)/AMP-acid ligase II